MSYEADARRQLIERLRNVYGSQANAYQGAALDDADLAQQKALMKAMKATRRAGVRTAKRCPPGNNKLCVEYACVPRAEAAKYRQNARALRALNKKSRSQGQRNKETKTAWAQLVENTYSAMRGLVNPVTGVEYTYKDALKAASQSYGGPKKGKKTKKTKRGKKGAPSAEAVKAAAQIIEDVMGPGAAAAAATPVQGILPRPVINPNLTYIQWLKAGYGTGSPQQRSANWALYKQQFQGSGMYNPNYGGPGYGAGRSGGVMMDSMYGEGYGGVLVDVFDDYQ